MITGVRPETFEKLQLNAGAFLKDFAYSTFADSAALETAVLAALESGEGVLGMTQGGGTFAVTPTYRQIEGDGIRNPFIGSQQIDSMTVKLTTTLKETTPENFKLAFGTATVTNSGKKTTVKIRNNVADSDYIPNLCWVGDTSKGLVLINISNALNTAGATFTFTDKGEGQTPVEFTAHQADLAGGEYAPCEIVFFEPAG